MTVKLAFALLAGACFGIAWWATAGPRKRSLPLRHRWIGSEIDRYLRVLPGEPGYDETGAFTGSATEVPPRNAA